MRMSETRLFKRSRPVFRLMTDPDEVLRVLWFAYVNGSFASLPRGYTNAELNTVMSYHMAGANRVWLVEDENSYFAGRGPVALVFAEQSRDGWSLHPHVEPFAWGTKRNVLRCYVAFFRDLRQEQSVGVSVSICSDAEKDLHDHLAHEYGVFSYVGTIKNGAPEGDRHVYSAEGGKSG